MSLNRLDPKADLNDPRTRAQLNETLDLLASRLLKQEIAGKDGAKGEKGDPGAGGGFRLSGVKVSKSSQAIPTGTGETLATFDTEHWDDDDWWSSGAATRVRIPNLAVGKRLLINALVSFETVTGGTYRTVRIERYNSSDVLQETPVYFATAAPSASLAYQTIVDQSAQITCQSGDYLTLSYSHDRGSDLSFTGTISVTAFGV